MTDKIDSSKKDAKNKVINVKEWVVFGILLVLFFIGGYQYACYTFTHQTDEYFTTQYINEYYPKGESEIQFIIEKVKNINDPIEKLTAIAEWESSDFINVLNYGYVDESYNKPVALVSNYKYDEEGRIRAVKGKYGNNPYWIAYHKTGACGELTSLFEYVVNQSGYETRLVKAEYANKVQNHAWLEVNIDDTWMFFDPTVYWDNEYLHLEDQWYGNLDEHKLWNETALTLKDQRTGENIASRYPNIESVDNMLEYSYYSIVRWINTLGSIIYNIWMSPQS